MPENWGPYVTVLSVGFPTKQQELNYMRLLIWRAAKRSAKKRWAEARKRNAIPHEGKVS